LETEVLRKEKKTLLATSARELGFRRTGSPNTDMAIKGKWLQNHQVHWVTLTHPSCKNGNFFTQFIFTKVMI
jgi:hypothetical protein